MSSSMPRRETAGAGPGGSRSSNAVLGLGVTGAAVAVVGLAVLVYSYVFANGVCCGDDSAIAIAAKNLAAGRGYGTSLPFTGSAEYRLFDPLLSTGPTLVLPAAALIAIFGVTPWAPGLATALVTTLLVVGTGVILGRRLGWQRALAFAAVMLAIQYTLTAGVHFIHWFTLLGEIPAAMFTVLGYAILTQKRRLPIGWAFLAFGLAFLTKTVALLGVLPAFIWVLVPLVRGRGRGREDWADLGVAVGTFALTPALFELWKLATLGFEDYLVTLRDSVAFISSSGADTNASGWTSRTARVLSNSQSLQDSFGVGPLVVLVAVLLLAWFIHTQTSGGTRLFAWLLLAGSGVHLTWYVVSSLGGSRYALIGMLLLAAAAACVVLSPSRTISVTAAVVVVVLAALPALPRLWGPVGQRLEAGLGPDERVRNLQATTDFLAGIDADERFVGGWWATVADLEYMLPTVSNFVRVDDLDPDEMHAGRLLVRNTRFVGYATSPTFTEWEEECDSVLFDAPPYLVTQCPSR